MDVIVEISMYPLVRDYDGPIHEFISNLRAHPDIEVTSGETSTTIRGDYEKVFGILHEEYRKVLANPDRVVFIMKLLNFES